MKVRHQLCIYSSIDCHYINWDRVSITRDHWLVKGWWPVSYGNYLSWTLQNWGYRSSAMSNFYMDAQDQTQTLCATWSLDSLILDFPFHFFSSWYLQIFPDFLLLIFYPGCTLYPGKETHGLQLPFSALWDS